MACQETGQHYFIPKDIYLYLKKLCKRVGVYPPFKLTFWIKIGGIIPVAVQFLSPRSNSPEDEKHKRETQVFTQKR